MYNDDTVYILCKKYLKSVSNFCVNHFYFGTFLTLLTVDMMLRLLLYFSMMMMMCLQIFGKKIMIYRLSSLMCFQNLTEAPVIVLFQVYIYAVIIVLDIGYVVEMLLMKISVKVIG